jgi:DNA-binding response OmpR family regulator
VLKGGTDRMNDAFNQRRIHRTLGVPHPLLHPQWRARSLRNRSRMPQRQIVIVRAVDDQQWHVDGRRRFPWRHRHGAPARRHDACPESIAGNGTPDPAFNEQVHPAHRWSAPVVPPCRGGHSHHRVHVTTQRGMTDHNGSAHRKTDRHHPLGAAPTQRGDRSSDIVDLTVAYGALPRRPSMPAKIKGNNRPEPGELVSERENLTSLMRTGESVRQHDTDARGVVNDRIEGDAVHGTQQQRPEGPRHGRIVTHGDQERTTWQTSMTLVVVTDTAVETLLPALPLLRPDATRLPLADAASLAGRPPRLVLIDTTGDLPGARRINTLIAASCPATARIAICTEGSLVAIGVDWNLADVLLASAGPAELAARLRWAEGRSNDPLTAATPDVLAAGGLTIDEHSYSARLGGRPLDLTFIEFELLKHLVGHPGRVFSRAQLLRDVWGTDFLGGTRTVDVHVRRLRAKLGVEHEGLIGTVRNVGYKFVPNGQGDT